MAGRKRAAPIATTADEAVDHAALLRRIWTAQVKALLAIVEATDPTEIPAATLANISRFLADNNVTADRIGQVREELQRLRTTEHVGFDAPLRFQDGDGSKDFV